MLCSVFVLHFVKNYQLFFLALFNPHHLSEVKTGGGSGVRSASDEVLCSVEAA